MSDFHHFLEEEEHFYQKTHNTKQSRKQRKQAQALDRSKYKKTDQNKTLSSKTIPLKALQGQVLGISSEWIKVFASPDTYRCQLRGLLKKERSCNKNLITIGDFVYFEPHNTDEGVIVHIAPRRSILSRADNLLRKKEQLIAANIDQVLIIASIGEPPLKPFLIDRYLIAAQKGGMQPLIIINKVDLFSDYPEEKDLAMACREAYLALGIPCLFVSTKTHEGLIALQEHMTAKSSVFSGQSGTGKSSLINALTTSSLKTGFLTEKTQKGAHTTTCATCIPLPQGGLCIDTPGIRSFGLWDVNAKDLALYFSDIALFASSCKFPGCKHRTEPECAVQEAVQQGKLSFLRFHSYQTLLDSLNEKHQTR